MDSRETKQDPEISETDSSPQTSQLPEHSSFTKEELIESFKSFVLKNKRIPGTVYEFVNFLSGEEKEFYEFFSSISGIQQEIWAEYFEKTVRRLKSEEVYFEYSVREKLLAFFYTLIEVLKEERSFIILSRPGSILPEWRPSFLFRFKILYFHFLEELIEEGKESGEVASRFLIDKQYTRGLWAQLLLIINFWVRDESEAFEKTDAAIEKAVNFSMDLMGKSPIDSFADFAKFLYQSWK